MTTYIQEVCSDEKPINFVEQQPVYKAVFPSQAGPVSIIEPVEEDHTFTLNVEFLERILLNPKFADKKVN